MSAAVKRYRGLISVMSNPDEIPPADAELILASAHDAYRKDVEALLRQARDALAVTRTWCPSRQMGQIEADRAIEAIDAALKE